MVDGVLADRVFSELQFPESVHHFGAELEPSLQLESHGSDGVVVEVGVGRRCAFVIKVFFDHVVHLLVIASRDTAYDDLGHVVVAHHRIDVIGYVGVVAVATWVVVHGVGYDALCAISVVVA